jgi:hypothetical protein
MQRSPNYLEEETKWRDCGHQRLGERWVSAARRMSFCRLRTGAANRAQQNECEVTAGNFSFEKLVSEVTNSTSLLQRGGGYR